MADALSYICPFCECEVRVGTPCGGCAKKFAKSKKPAQPKKPWESPSSSDGLDLPDSEFDYEAFVAREFAKTPHQTLGVKWYWWILGVALLGGMIASVFWRG